MSTCARCGSSLGKGNERVSTIVPNTSLPYLRSQLSELDALIASLTAERQRLQAKSDAIVYPVLSLPPEITMEVFVRCLPSESDRCPSWKQAPLLLAQICRQWRQIALDTPALWQSLHFTDGHSSINLLHLWLSRSGSLPLNFSLHCAEPLRAGALIEATMLHSHRWQDVKFMLPRTSFGDLNLRDTFLPILRSISLRIAQWTSDDTNMDTVMIQNAPALCEVELCMFPIKAEMPWLQMTTITLQQDIDFMECITMLRRCLKLRNLTVRTTGPAASHTDTLTLDSLESLTCNFGVATILEHLTLPHLKQLTVTETREIGDVTSLTAFVRRSECALKYFSISIDDIPPETLILCLRAIPSSVSELELIWPRGDLPDNNELFTALQPIYILPHLTALRLRGVCLSNTDFQSLSDMLRIRVQWLPPNTSLKSLTLHLTMDSRINIRRYLPSASTMAQLRELVAAGLQVKFTIAGRYGDPTCVMLDSSLT